MEGDHSSASLMLREYKHIIDYLSTRRKSSSKPEFNSLLDKMIEKTKVYQDEAMNCDAVLLSTMLNPAYRLSVFQVWFNLHHTYARDLLQDKFNEQKAEQTANFALRASSPPVTSQPPPSNHTRDTDAVNLFPDATNTPADDELNAYLGGKHKIPLANADQCLKWWKQVLSAASQLQPTFARRIAEA
ncbi:hypothetical protein PCASD_24759 [Puccinia coronata f. sp. avenae]|uniref:HAT C-terminal dimerisation domain-containing protein n=1 Tax=Puccinia coronata f. sp. avenae TaxID=200324 RepID=A0A2N5SAJ5_9BASI|nr:hypothetical protein PCASD_24759 [Puccinia coronata f. sp. avenae]